MIMSDVSYDDSADEASEFHSDGQIKEYEIYAARIDRWLPDSSESTMDKLVGENVAQQANH
jgi:hypothetical protein